MPSVLDRIPGLGGYVAAQQQGQQQTMGQLQQAGAVLGLQGALQKQQQEQAYRTDLAKLGANPQPEQILGVLAKHDPAKAADLQMKQEAAKDRAFQFAQNLEMRQQVLDMQKQQALQRTEDAQARQRFEEQYKMESLNLKRQQDLVNTELRRMGFEITRQGQQLQLQRFDADKAAREEREIEGQIGKTADRMKDVQPVWTAAQQLNATLSRYTPENIPGVGYLKNTDLGKVALTQEGKDVSASIKLFGNSVLKAMSGAAVTAPEEIRQMAAQMADGRFSAEDFYVAWPKMAKWVNDQVSLSTAGLTPKAKERFLDRTGLKLDPLKPRFEFKEGKLQDTTAPQRASGKVGDLPPPPPGFNLD
jgi:uncharacterized protein YcgL (UPF0745 family)